MVMSVILAAGKGTRMNSELPKVLHPLLGAPLLEYSLENVEALGCSPRVVVVGYKKELIEKAFEGRGVIWGHQDVQQGTGQAAHIGVEAGGAEISDDESVIVLNGDLPLLKRETLRSLLETHSKNNAEVSVLTCIKDVPYGYGRIVRKGGDGAIESIIEEKDASEDIKSIQEINVGVYVFRHAAFKEFYQKIGCDNAQGEYYLTDVVVEAVKAGKTVSSFTCSEEWEIDQVNSRRELASVSEQVRARWLGELMDQGVTIDDPKTTYIEKGVQIGRDSRIFPFTYISSGVVIESGCQVGPFAHLRAGTVLKPGAEIGNFVEVKASEIGEKTKAKHLSYLGNVKIGQAANIGAGTIVANYDGKNKHPTEIGDQAFIGSGSILVAPVKVGKQAQTGAGAVVTREKDVADGETVIGVPAKPIKVKNRS